MPGIHPIDTRLREMLESERRIRGVFNGIPSPAIVEMCGYAGFDFVIIDNEHGSADLQLTEHMLRAARASGIAAIVRCLPHDMSRVLDMGASAILAPMINNVTDARELVKRARYRTTDHSEWARGSAFSTRAAGYGAFGGEEHAQRSNAGVVLIAMIESPEGVESATEISSIAGLDGIFVGPNDLAHGMGHQNSWEAQPVQDAMRHVLEVAAAAGKCPGILALTAADEDKYSQWGARFFASVTTGIITKAFEDAAQRANIGLNY